MFKQALVALALLGSTTAASADALHRNPDQSADTRNMNTFGKATIPIGAYQYCQRYISRCSYRKIKDSEKLSQAVWDAIVNVNLTVNRSVRPMTDQDYYGVEERWELPVGVGDCEDYVLEKKKRLATMGIAPGALRVTVVYDANGGGHAVLTVVTDQGDLILDNNINKVLRWQDAELTYLKRQLPGDMTRWENLRGS
jgi:predicted transglutaminase-like cysteine proteinase